MLSVIIARSSAYVVVVHVERDVLKWYPMLSFSNHLRSGSKNIINMYGLRVSPCMIPWLISTGGVVLKWFPMNFLYIFPTILTASREKSRSSIRASSLTWLMELKALWKSMYVVYILVDESCVLKGYYDNLDLSWGVPLQVKSLLSTV